MFSCSDDEIVVIPFEKPKPPLVVISSESDEDNKKSNSNNVAQNIRKKKSRKKKRDLNNTKSPQLFEDRSLLSSSNTLDASNNSLQSDATESSKKKKKKKKTKKTDEEKSGGGKNQEKKKRKNKRLDPLIQSLFKPDDNVITVLTPPPVVVSTQSLSKDHATATEVSVSQHISASGCRDDQLASENVGAGMTNHNLGEGNEKSINAELHGSRTVLTHSASTPGVTQSPTIDRGVFDFRDDSDLAPTPSTQSQGPKKRAKKKTGKTPEKRATTSSNASNNTASTDNQTTTENSNKKKPSQSNEAGPGIHPGTSEAMASFFQICFGRPKAPSDVAIEVPKKKRGKKKTDSPEKNSSNLGKLYLRWDPVFDERRINNLIHDLYLVYYIRVCCTYSDVTILGEVFSLLVYLYVLGY